MQLIHFYIFMVIYFCRVIAINEDLQEDIQILKLSIAKYGPPQPPQEFNLPGPEVVVGNETLKHKNFLIGEIQNFTYRYRSHAANFSYNGHYETTEKKMIGNREFIVVKGQFAEEIPRKNGGYYIRTIGYVSDENGPRLFLLDITKVVTVNIRDTKEKRIKLSPSSLASLVG